MKLYDFNYRNRTPIRLPLIENCSGPTSLERLIGIDAKQNESM